MGSVFVYTAFAYPLYRRSPTTLETLDASASGQVVNPRFRVTK